MCHSAELPSHSKKIKSLRFLLFITFVAVFNCLNLLNCLGIYTCNALELVSLGPQDVWKNDAQIAFCHAKYISNIERSSMCSFIEKTILWGKLFNYLKLIHFSFLHKIRGKTLVIYNLIFNKICTPSTDQTKAKLSFFFRDRFLNDKLNNTFMIQLDYLK